MTHDAVLVSAPARAKVASPSLVETPEALARRFRELDLYDHALAIARCWHITLHDMIHSLRRPAPSARQAFYRYLRDLGWSYPRIGAFVGRDHTTILAACRGSSEARA